MEDMRICAFFDALGTREIMLGSNESRRIKLIKLIRRLASRETSYSANAENLGGAISLSPTAEVTSFSDNVAISFPIKRMNLPGSVGGEQHTFYLEVSDFLNHLIIHIIIAVWDGLKIGVLFRGAITTGKLVHDDEIIAGEALVKAVELEKETKYPRIEIAHDVMMLVDQLGQPVVNDRIKEMALIEVEGRWFVRVFDLHMGYWREHNYFRERAGEMAEDIPSALKRIRVVLDQEFSSIMSNENESAKEKWIFFMRDFENTFRTGLWQRVPGALEAACP